ncbi:MAG: hypothetical protein WC884_04275 [Candidatus Paceibacterota bacterium]
MINQRHLTWEKMLWNLLKKYDYKILEKNLEGGYESRPDFVVEKEGKKIVIELKVQNIITSRVVYQILYYKETYKAEKAYLAIHVNGPKINANIKQKLSEMGIGIIRIHRTELLFTEPITSKNSLEEDYENYEAYKENTQIAEKVDESSKEVKELSREFFIYIILGGILVFLINRLIDEFLKGIIYTVLLIIICCILFFCYWFFIKSKRKNER